MIYNTKELAVTNFSGHLAVILKAFSGRSPGHLVVAFQGILWLYFLEHFVVIFSEHLVVIFRETIGKG